jgi:hypothetical protein
MKPVFFPKPLGPFRSSHDVPKRSAEDAAKQREFAEKVVKRLKERFGKKRAA